MNIIASTPSLVSDIYLLTCTITENDTGKLNVIKYALELLIVFCSYLSNGVKLIRQASKEAAIVTRSQPFANFAMMMHRGDLDLQANTVTLMNVLIAKSEKESTKKKLFVSWQANGIIEKLEELDSEYPATKQQLEIFQSISNYTIPRSWFAAEMFRAKLEDISKRYEQLQEKIFEYQRQQPVIKMLKSELANTHETLRVMSMAYNIIPSMCTA